MIKPRTMPVLKPIVIPTKGLPWYKKAIKVFKARSWEIVSDYYVEIPGLNKTLLVPKGFVFNAASIPRALWPFLNPTGVLLIGSIIHDFAYRYNCLLDKEGNILYNDKGRDFFDDLFEDINNHINDANFMHSIARTGLGVFGWVGWDRHRKRNRKVYEDFPFVSFDKE